MKRVVQLFPPEKSRIELVSRAVCGIWSLSGRNEFERKLAGDLKMKNIRKAEKNLAAVE